MDKQIEIVVSCDVVDNLLREIGYILIKKNTIKTVELILYENMRPNNLLVITESQINRAKCFISPQSENPFGHDLLPIARQYPLNSPQSIQRSIELIDNTFVRLFSLTKLINETT